MIPKEKAEELLRKMLSKNPCRQDGISMIDTIQAKLCALVAVDEILKQCEDSNFGGFELWWQEVKQELEKL